jgi:hypothetical protein
MILEYCITLQIESEIKIQFYYMNFDPVQNSDDFSNRAESHAGFASRPEKSDDFRTGS